jgi:hypothetical protein
LASCSTQQVFFASSAAIGAIHLYVNKLLSCDWHGRAGHMHLCLVLSRLFLRYPSVAMICKIAQKDGMKTFFLKRPANLWVLRTKKKMVRDQSGVASWH